MHSCKAKHEISIPIVEIFGSDSIGEGVVESFALSGHPKAKRCYAWRFLENDEPHYIAVLEIPPVDSPQSAVKVAIAEKAQKP